MRKIILTSSAKWLFDVVKHVMSSSTVPGKKKKKRSEKPSKARKAKVTVTFLKEQNIQILALAHAENSELLVLSPSDY